MNVPLSWLADYVTLPKSTKELTDKLTMVGHLLDKITKKGNVTVIDLELRGNRSDMFGLIGVARDISAILNSPLKLPEVANLPKKDSQHPLVIVEKSAQALVKRYEVLRLKVKICPSPKWLIERLRLYGIPSINNVVDVTNYVMVETGIPLHAFDYHKINSGKLILRMAKKGEKFQTIQQGLTVQLTDQDLVVGDALTMIGGMASKVTEVTTEILLEAAVYHPGSCRRSARRLKIFTEASMRLEKYLDPEAVEFALARAVYLIKGEVVGQVSDYYPKPVKPKTIKFDAGEIFRLSGVEVGNWQKILESLEFRVDEDIVTVPSFRTDVEGSADLVEEVVRIYGYDKIPESPLSGQTPAPMTYPTYAFSEKLRNILTSLGLHEVITLTMVDQGEIALVNPPDPDLKWLRSNIYPSLVKYCQRRKVNIFEIGNTFTGTAAKYHEHMCLAVAVRDNLSGVLQKLESLLGVKDLPVKYGKINEIFWAEIDLDKLLPQVPKFINPYSIVSQFPPVIEDVNINYDGNYGKLLAKIKKISGLIKQIELIDNYDNKLTLRITYHSDTKQLSSSDISPVRQKLSALSSSK